MAERSAPVQPLLAAIVRATWRIAWTRQQHKAGNRTAERLRRMLKVHGPLIGLHIEDRPAVIEQALGWQTWHPSPPSWGMPGAWFARTRTGKVVLDHQGHRVMYWIDPAFPVAVHRGETWRWTSRDWERLR